eukprot:TRINITY_DN1030_c0_g1_i2.p1 TRINITY_DN1030_c0_g1~~TRINITY_DN1030_c0_g1_i2.p1  ORF type:complete len:108 (-),score=20.13 TRINITY_DN1030_c0_g1_i2:71-394(-)
MQSQINRRIATITGHLAPQPSHICAQKTSAATFTAEEVAKHNKKDDCWVIVDGQVINATSFLADHPGGEKAIMLYAGKDASEEFNMIHDDTVLKNHAADLIVGSLKQ